MSYYLEINKNIFWFLINLFDIVKMRVMLKVGIGGFKIVEIGIKI